MHKQTLVTAGMVILISCGQQPLGTKTEYYVEEPSSSREKESEGSDKPNDADATVEAKAFDLVITKPTAGASADQLVVQVDIKNPVQDATWSLLYSPNLDLSQPIVIESDLPVTQTQVTWDISALATGSYYIYAEVNVDGKILVFKTTEPVVVEEEAIADNKKPTISLQFPLGENVFVVGTEQNIRWDSTDPDSDPISFKIEYSANAGTTWTMIATNVTAKTYAWNAAGLTQGITYRVRVTATDDKGATAVATSPRNFGVALTPMTFAGGFGTLIRANNTCGRCHNAAGPNQAQFRSDNYALATIGVAAKQMNIKTRIENNTMPPGTPLTPVQKEQLTMWIWDGAR